MRKLYPLLVCFILYIVAGACDAASQQEGGKMTRLKIGDIEVISIQDVPGAMNASLFKGPLTATQIEKYMPGGTAEASVNVFLVKTGEKIVLIDTGWGSEGKLAGTMLATLKANGIEPEIVDVILITHLHSDHIMGLSGKGQAVFPKAKLMLSKPESAFWRSAELKNQVAFKSRVDIIENMLGPYDNRIELFDFGQTVAPGIAACQAAGHTPGHTAFMIGSGESRLLIAGDFLHAATLQFPHPKMSASYDMDPAQAANTRQALLEKAAEEKFFLGGMHIPHPGIVQVTKNNATSFDYVLMEAK